MATDRLSIPLGASFSASQLAALQASDKMSLARAPDGLAKQEMAPATLTLPPRSKSFQAPSALAQQKYFEESLRRSTVIENLGKVAPGDESVDDTQSSFSTIIDRLSSDDESTIFERLSSVDESTVFERLSSVDGSAIDLASEHAKAPETKTLAERLSDIQAKGLQLDEVAKNIDKAKSVNVDPAKRTFWQKFGGATVSLGVVVLFTALTISTGGAAAIAGLSAAAVMFAKNSGDTYCALKVLQNKNAQSRGEEPPHSDVPMGADSIGNLCHSALSKLNKQKITDGQMSPDDLKAKAKSWSLGINIALRVVSFSASGVGGIASGAAWLPRLASIAFSAATMVIGIAIDQLKQKVEESGKLYTDEKLPLKMLKLCDQYSEILENANNLPEDQQGELLNKIGTGLETLEADFDELEARLLKTQEKFEQPSSTAAQAIRGGITEGFLFAGGVQASRRALEFIPTIKSAGMNLESAAASVMLFKTAYDSWKMINDVSQRSQTLKSHQDTIIDLRRDIHQFV